MDYAIQHQRTGRYVASTGVAYNVVAAWTDQIEGALTGTEYDMLVLMGQLPALIPMHVVQVKQPAEKPANYTDHVLASTESLQTQLDFMHRQYRSACDMYLQARRLLDRLYLHLHPRDPAVRGSVDAVLGLLERGGEVGAFLDNQWSPE